MLDVQNGQILVETSTLRAQFIGARLTSLAAKAGGEPMLSPSADGPVIQAIYVAGDDVDLGNPGDAVSYNQLSASRVDIRIHGWDADAVLTVSECLETGALLVEPSVCSTRPGLLACRWLIDGIPPALALIAPFYQGVRLQLDDPLIGDTHWSWPSQWEAGLAILQGASGGFWVHVQDDRYQCKALQVGADGASLGFESEAHGPVGNNRASGGLAWRINTYLGDWQVPAGIYRDWLRTAYGLARREATRPGWIGDIGLAVTWASPDLNLLDALATQVEPRRTLIHLADWRTDPYDENYPTYTPSASARAFVAKGTAMGFHIAPHANSIDMDPTHLLYPSVRDFAYRDVRTGVLLGWAWDPGTETILGVPNGGGSLVEHRNKKVMVKIHPGSALWRSLLAEQVGRALAELQISTIFLDVTLNTWNLRTGIVEGQSATEGMLRLLDKVADIGEGVVLGGEGLNEITAQALSFAQAHLFRSHHRSIAGLDRAGGTPLNAFLFRGLARTIGYANLAGRDADQKMRLETHLSLGAIPTVDGLTVDAALRPNPVIARAFELAKG